MPILLRVQELEPGMGLAGNLMNQYSMLLPANHVIGDKDIAALNRLMPDAMVSIKDPVLDGAVDFQDDSKDHVVSRKARQGVSKVAAKVSQQLRNGVTLDGKSVAGLRNTVSELTDYILTNPVANAVIEKSAGWDDYLQEHSANVFYLSILIGNTIKNYIKRERERLTAAKSVKNAMDLVPLGTAAMLHDIGMATISDLYQKKGPLTPEEVAIVKQHPIKGADLLPEQMDPMVKMVVRMHHENNDGSGYPQGLPGEKINIFAKIVRVADAYSSAVCDKIYQQAKHPAIVLHEMLNTSITKYYDPVILKVFTGIVQPFPIGAKLLLNNGKWGVVVKYNGKKPFNPYIVVAYDEFGDPEPPASVSKLHELGSEDAIKVKSFAGYDMTALQDDNYDAELNLENSGDIFHLHYP